MRMNCTTRSYTLTLWLALISLAPLIISGCSSGPALDELQQSVQQRLDNQFKKNLFRIESFKRMGVYHSSTDDGQPRLRVYFDAKLRFLQPYSMADWNALGLEALMRVVGAGTRGIEGIAPEGNKPDDTLLVHGSLMHAMVANSWTAEGTTAGLQRTDLKTSVTAKQYAEIKTMLDELGTLSRTAVDHRDVEAVERIHSIVRISRNRLKKITGTLHSSEIVVATGHVAGTYYPLGQALAGILRKAQIPSRMQQSEGSLENCRLINFGYAQLAVCQNDVAQQAFEGTGAFEGGPLEGLCSLCSWYPEPVQIIVSASSDLTSVSQLSGRRVCVGQPSSGSKVNALQVLEAAGLSDDDLAELVHAPPIVGLAKLASGEVDAVFLTEASPARSVAELTERGLVRLLSLEPELIQGLTRRHRFYIPLVIAARHYPGQDEPVHTVAVTATLIATPKLPNETVKRILELQYENLSAFIHAHPKGAAIGRQHAMTGLSLALHPGAAEFFEADAKKR